VVLRYLRQRPDHIRRLRTFSVLLTLKLLFTVALIGVLVVGLASGLRADVDEVEEDASSPPSSSVIAVPLILIATLSFSCLCLVLHKKSVHITSLAQFFFWLMLTLVTVPTFASSVRNMALGGEKVTMTLRKSRR
jgi:uncharacterized BrkB/YihY/UPF0761 family membrane protein